jgi:hypothetical protein
MSRDRRGNGVQVVGGSNPPCPTNRNPNPPNNFAALAASHPPAETGRVSSFALGNFSELPEVRPTSPAIAEGSQWRSTCNALVSSVTTFCPLSGHKEEIEMTRKHLFILAAVLVVPLARAQTLPANAKPTCTVSAPLFASWFQSGSPTLDGVVKPANSLTTPTTPNCSFYQWSEQMYLWLTSKAPIQYGSGRVFDSGVFYDVSPPDANGQRTFIPHTSGIPKNLTLRAAQVGPHGLPIVFDKTGKMFEIQKPKLSPAGRPLILNRLGKEIEVKDIRIGADKKPVFLDNAGKAIDQPKPILRPELMPVPLQLNKTRAQAAPALAQRFSIGNTPVILTPSGAVVDVEQGQAGGDGVLVAQNGSLVYYATMVNDVYAYFLTGAKTPPGSGGINPTPTQFPTTQTELNKVIAFGAAHGKTFPDANALAIEVKTSWVEAAGLPNLASYITMTATVPSYNKANPNLWVNNGQKTVLLAMTAIHVVGSTRLHPEMIWATFEHFGNAPNATFSYVTNTNATTTVNQNTAGTWLFCANNAGSPFNALHADFASAPNIESVSPFTISPSNTLREKAFGAATNANPNPLVNAAASNTEIIAINNSVILHLIGSDIRKNYYMTGSTWTTNGSGGTGPFPSGNEVGTSQLANSTMETYQQGTTLVGTGANCLDCHASNQTTVSHIFAPLKKLF